MNDDNYIPFATYEVKGGNDTITTSHFAKRVRQRVSNGVFKDAIRFNVTKRTITVSIDPDKVTDEKRDGLYRVLERASRDVEWTNIALSRYNIANEMKTDTDTGRIPALEERIETLQAALIASQGKLKTQERDSLGIIERMQEVIHEKEGRIRELRANVSEYEAMANEAMQMYEQAETERGSSVARVGDLEKRVRKGLEVPEDILTGQANVSFFYVAYMDKFVRPKLDDLARTYEKMLAAKNRTGDLRSLLEQSKLPLEAQVGYDEIKAKQDSIDAAFEAKRQNTFLQVDEAAVAETKDEFERFKEEYRQLQADMTDLSALFTGKKTTYLVMAQSSDAKREIQVILPVTFKDNEEDYTMLEKMITSYTWMAVLNVQREYDLTGVSANKSQSQNLVQYTFKIPDKLPIEKVAEFGQKLQHHLHLSQKEALFYAFGMRVDVTYESALIETAPSFDSTVDKQQGGTA